MHGVGRQASKLVLAGALEELPEALDAVEGLHPAPGLARHDARERDHDEAGQTRPEGKRPRRRPQLFRPGGERPPRHTNEGDARHEPDRPHPLRRGGKESVAHHAPVDLVTHGGEDVVVVPPEVGELAGIEPPVASEDPAEHVELERLEGGIARERLEPVKDEIFLAEVGLDLLDADIAAHGQIDKGGDHVARLRSFGDESSPGRGTESLGRGILRLDGAGSAGIPSIDPPDDQSARDGQEGQREGPVVTQPPQGPARRRGPSYGAGRPAHGHRQPFARAKRARGAEGQVRIGAVHRVVRPRGPRRPGIGDGLNLLGRDRGGRRDDGLGLANRHVPLRAGDIPVQLLVPVHRHERSPHAIGEDDRLGRVHRARDPDLDVKGPPQPGDLGS